MPRLFTANEYADMVYCFGLSNSNADAAVRLYRERFPERRRVPTANTIRAASNRARVQGALVPNLHLERVRPRDAVMERVAELVNNDRTISTRDVARLCGISQTMAHRIMQRDLGMYPFHYRRVHHIG